jgi:hypothetical protein
MVKKAVIKTARNEDSVEDFLAGLKDERQREDSLALTDMMRKVSKEEPKMWGKALIGFGHWTVKSPSGREVDWMRIGFSPRKANLSVYLTSDIGKNYAAELKALGKHKTGMGCLYIAKLADVDAKVLKAMLAAAWKRKGYFDR